MSELKVIRVEEWRTGDGRLAVVDVQQPPYGGTECVVVAYDLIVQMFTELGMTKENK